jgi:hypothetical protein
MIGIPRKPGIDVDGIAETEADHFMKCPDCGRWFDMRDQSDVLKHVHEGDVDLTLSDGGTALQ